MTLPLDVHCWSEDRIQQELAARLPKGWGFSLLKDPATLLWVVRVFSADCERWRGQDAAPNLALLHALGWVVLQTAKPRKSGPWVRRSGEITLERVHESAFRAASPEPDPEDLDPSVVLVYSQRRTNGGK